jgi:hypothetical protein
VNSAPVLAAIGNQVIDEGTELIFIASASDADLPAQTLTFSIDEAAIAKGMTISEATGAFSWMPSESQDGSHEVSVTLSDGELSDSETIIITVNEVNNAPVLAAIGNKSVEEGAELTFTATTTDLDVPSQTLSYSLDATSLEKRMSVGATSGEFSWSPGSDRVGEHQITLSVSDGIASVSESFRILVIAVDSSLNSPPMVVEPMVDQMLGEGFGSIEMSIASVFTDADGDELFIVVESSDPMVATASIADVTLTITEAGVGTTTITLIATDGNGGSATESFDVQVQPATVSGFEGPGISQVAVYPNPTSGRLVVQLGGSSLTHVDVVVRDLSGQQLSVSNAMEAGGELIAEVDVTTLAPGIYLLEINMDGRPVATRKIIKK